MARFVKIIDKDDCEAILDIDKIEQLTKTKFLGSQCYNYRVYIGGRIIGIDEDVYERLKTLLIPPYTIY